MLPALPSRGRFSCDLCEQWRGSGGPGTIDFGEILTDAKGEIRLHEQGKRLYPGEYTITEIRPAPGFQMKEPSTQKIILHGSESKTVTFENVPLNAIIVEKYDSVTHEALPGCTFQLRYLGGTSGTGGTVIGQKVTGKTAPPSGPGSRAAPTFWRRWTQQMGTPSSSPPKRSSPGRQR